MIAHYNSSKHMGKEQVDALKNKAPLVAASGAILFPSTAIEGVVRYDDGLRQH